MRKGIAGLSALAQDVLRQQPASGAVFAFRGRRGDRIKILVWDGQGSCIYPSRDLGKEGKIGRGARGRRGGLAGAGAVGVEARCRNGRRRSRRSGASCRGRAVSGWRC
jgi:hypothetical protein